MHRKFYAALSMHSLLYFSFDDLCNEKLVKLEITNICYFLFYLYLSNGSLSIYFEYLIWIFSLISHFKRALHL